MLKLWKLKKSRTKSELKYNRTHDGSMLMKRKILRHRRGCEFTVKEGSSAIVDRNQTKKRETKKIEMDDRKNRRG